MQHVILEWCRKWRRNQGRFEDGVSAAVVARRHGLDRRRFNRIRLPAVNFQLFPQLCFQGRELPVVDISVGGACLRDPLELLLDHLGNETDLILKWPTHEERLRVRVVAASRHVNRHIQFLNLSNESYRQIEDLVRFGSYGQRFKQAPVLRTAPAQLNAIELWTGVVNDVLTFYDDSACHAEMLTGDLALRFHRDRIPSALDLDNRQPTRPATIAEIKFALTVLANIPYPSVCLSQLIDHLAQKPHHWLRIQAG